MFWTVIHHLCVRAAAAANDSRLGVRAVAVALAAMGYGVFGSSPPAQAQSIDAKAQICTACHGTNGVPVAQSFPVPVIWGQQLGYLFIELRDFKSGARKNDVMSPIAQSLDQADLLPLAQYFSQKPWPNLQQPRPTADVAAQAQRADASVVCTSCHQQGYLGASTQPRLAGQEAAYLKKTMLDFRDGARANNPGMTDLMKAVSEADIAALAAYLGGM